MGFVALDEAWGPADAPMPMPTANHPDKVFANGPPSKVFANGPPVKAYPNEYLAASEQIMQRMAMQQQRHAAEIARLQQLLAGAQNGRGRSGIMDVCMLVSTLVFVVLVLYLIGLVSRLNIRL